jgi:hypothetical protein
MTDPLSITASIAAVLQLSGTAIKVLTTIYNATEEQKRIKTEISPASGILFHLKDLAERSQNDGNWALATQSLTVPHGPIA